MLDRANSVLLAAPTVFHYLNYFEDLGAGQASRVLRGGG